MKNNRMKNLALIVFMFCSCPWLAHAGSDEDSYNSAAYLQKDRHQASYVALIHPLDMAPSDKVKAFGNVYQTRAQVIESFKGGAKAGSPVEFYTVFEEAPSDFYRKHDRIVFLLKGWDKDLKQWIFMELENSTRDATKANLDKLRK